LITSLFNGRLFGKVDYTTNPQGPDSLAVHSAVNGTTSQKLNNAEMTNRGVELELVPLSALKEMTSYGAAA